MISGTGRGAFAIFLASHESCFKAPSDYYTMEAHRVLGLSVHGLDLDPKEPRIHETTRVRTWSRGSGP
jgi:hypothetical protein